jgi:hypothetical protein
MQLDDVDVGKFTDGDAELGQHGETISAESCRWRVARRPVSSFDLTPRNPRPAPERRTWAHRAGANPRHRNGQSCGVTPRKAPPSEVEVPGGVVSIEPPKGTSGTGLWFKLLFSALWRSYFAAERMDRDIVVRDKSRQRELYREGPYDAITVIQPLERLLSEIRSTGLDSFLRTRQVAASRVGPLDAPGRVGQMSPYFSRGKSDPK